MPSLPAVMVDALPALLAAVIAISITLLELVTSAYRHTHFLLWKRWQLWVYVLVYGAIAFGLMTFVDVLIANKYITLEGLGTGSPWVRAVIVGVTVKALMQITFFNVATGPSTLPIGISTFVKLYEPTLLESLSQGVWNRGRTFLGPYAARYNDIANVRTTIQANVPPTLSADRKAALLVEIGTKATVVEVLEAFLIFAGKGTPCSARFRFPRGSLAQRAYEGRTFNRALRLEVPAYAGTADGCSVIQETPQLP